MTAMRDPVLSGEITTEGMLSVIQEIERLRTTGVLEFEHGDVRGEVQLIAGQIALDQKEMADGADPVEVLLSLREGSYRMYQRLPTLPVSKGDDMSRTGSLAVHVPADLMRYCEHAGMTGTLLFENDGRSAEVVYDAGELVAIRVEGTDEEDLHEVFGWEEGTFRIQALSRRPPVDEPAEAASAQPEATPEPDPAAPRRRDETGQMFLRSVEVALTRIVEEREKRRSPTRTSPPLPPPPKARSSDSFPGIEPAPEPVASPQRRDPTVRVIYLNVRKDVDAGEGLRHVRKDVAGEVALTDAAPERRRGAPGSDPPPGDPDAPAQTTLAGTLGWVLVVFALVVAALGLLAWLPPIE